jgi:hypothetical protein
MNHSAREGLEADLIWHPFNRISLMVVNHDDPPIPAAWIMRLMPLMVQIARPPQFYPYGWGE